MNWKANFTITSIYAAAFALLYLMFISSMEEAIRQGNLHLNKATTFQTARVTVNPQVRSELYSALGEYNKVLFFDRENISVLNNRASAFYRLGSYKLALEDLSTCINLQPADWYHFHMRGKCFEKMGNREAAFRDYNRSLVLAHMEVSPSASYITGKTLDDFVKNVSGPNIASQPMRSF